MRKGEIWFVEFPEGSGSKQSGRRPAIIIRKIEGTNMCIAAPLTSNPDARRFPYILPISANKRNNLMADSVALIFQLTALDVSIVRRKFGSLKRSTIRQIDNILAEMLLLSIQQNQK